MRKDDIKPVGYKVKAGSKSKIDSKQLVAGYFGNSFESAGMLPVFAIVWYPVKNK